VDVDTNKYPNWDAFAMNQATSGISAAFYLIPEIKKTLSDLGRYFFGEEKFRH